LDGTYRLRCTRKTSMRINPLVAGRDLRTDDGRLCAPRRAWRFIARDSFENRVRGGEGEVPLPDQGLKRPGVPGYRSDPKSEI